MAGGGSSRALFFTQTTDDKKQPVKYLQDYCGAYFVNSCFQSSCCHKPSPLVSLPLTWSQVLDSACMDSDFLTSAKEAVTQKFQIMILPAKATWRLTLPQKLQTAWSYTRQQNHRNTQPVHLLTKGKTTYRQTHVPVQTQHLSSGIFSPTTRSTLLKKVTTFSRNIRIRQGPVSSGLRASLSVKISDGSSKFLSFRSTAVPFVCALRQSGPEGPGIRQKRRYLPCGCNVFLAITARKSSWLSQRRICIIIKRSV